MLILLLNERVEMKGRLYGEIKRPRIYFKLTQMSLGTHLCLSFPI